MPGIFSPTLQESGTAIQPVGAVTDNTIGNALQGLGNIASGVMSTLDDDDDSLTQKDRDNAALQPFMKRAAIIKDQRDSGNLSPFRYRSELERITTEAITSLPMLKSDIVAGIHGITGVDTDMEDQSPDAVLLRGRAEWASTPEGQFFAKQSIVTNAEGGYDLEASTRRMDVFYLNSLAGKVELEQLQQEVARVEANTALKQTKLDEIGTSRLQKHIQIATDKAVSLIDQFATNLDSSNIIDSQVVLEALNNEIMLARTMFTQEMAAFNGSTTYDIEAALAPLLNLKTMVETRRDDIPKLAEAAKSQDAVLFRRGLQKLYGAGPVNDDVATHLQNSMMFSNINELGTMLQVRDGFLVMRDEIWGNGAVATTDADGNETVPTDASTVFDPDVAEQFSNLPEGEAEAQVKGLITFFKATPLEAFSTDTQRELAVAKFGMGIAAAQSLEGRGPLSNNTLKNIYNADFMRRYEKVASFNDMTATNMRKAVQFHLSSVFSAKLSILERDASGNKISLTFKDGKITANIPENMSSFAKNRGGFPVGSREQLQEQQRNNGLSPRLTQQLMDLNEVYKIMRSIPDEKTKKAFETFVTETFAMKAQGHLNFVEVRTRQDYDNAPSGSIVIWKNSDGSNGEAGIKP